MKTSFHCLEHFLNFFYLCQLSLSIISRTALVDRRLSEFCAEERINFTFESLSVPDLSDLPWKTVPEPNSCWNKSSHMTVSVGDRDHQSVFVMGF